MASISYSSTTVNQLMNLVDEYRDTISEVDYIQMCNLLKDVHNGRVRRPATTPVVRVPRDDPYPPRLTIQSIPRYHGKPTPNRFLVYRPNVHLNEISYLEGHKTFLIDRMESDKPRLRASDKVYALFKLLEEWEIPQPQSVRLATSKPRAYIKDAMDLLPEVRRRIQSTFYSVKMERHAKYIDTIKMTIEGISERLKILRADRLGVNEEVLC